MFTHRLTFNTVSSKPTLESSVDVYCSSQHSLTATCPSPSHPRSRDYSLLPTAEDSKRAAAPMPLQSSTPGLTQPIATRSQYLPLQSNTAIKSSTLQTVCTMPFNPAAPANLVFFFFIPLF
ncbi:hypothetical protein H112_05997 [Trichophyton rubrum D6]|uniref:Uncharacterized protein n=2 Tax=Trichophyton TaxID=5550 RepID=A0A022VY00_TRIRU|nr:hypothetical protein H100_06011 [Trichophyton rubrum MR850]EZF39943.1 hypothetical protein H102_05980 [Trichophyton rubrum CBS 100081]EZF50583.1 hypothetical protein H103_06005 [Trichophyton rubrum CBS 288.86]EZF61127.1 hypothetical protein H104_05993 [Trichophyton rubrum CBS 289.86]EZF71760.1 hypothetical protein H105_06020 [Trichophyton soudanense CBS 452.61]EZF82343.1 hypothetical protein H110_06001 [Trichophyton rubrum MR1448]EZF93019.1 hypothetical protein H113_06048 [Trichophyton rub